MFGSHTAANLLGYSEKELVTLALGAILDPVQAVKLLLIPKRMAAGKFFESELTFYRKEHSYIHIRSQFFVDDTNWFKNGRMLLIVFRNESRENIISRPATRDGWETELFREIRRVQDSLQSLHKVEPEHSITADID